MPTRLQLALTATVLLICMLTMNFGVTYLTRNSVPRRVMRHARESESAEVVALGNSLMAAGLDESEFDASAGSSTAKGIVNLSLGASSPVEQLLLFRYALAHHIQPRLIIYGFYDLQLSQPNRLSINDIIGNRAMLYYVEPRYARRFYSLPFHDSIQFAAMHSIRMFADRGAIWAKVELLRRKMSEEGMPTQTSNQFGRANDFALLEPSSVNSFERECEADAQLPLAAPVEELLRQAHAQNIAIAVVEMPMRSAHRSRFYSTQAWRNYIDHVRAQMSPYQVNFIDASDWVEDDSLFVDPLHLSNNGADLLSRRLGQLLGSEAVVPNDRRPH